MSEHADVPTREEVARKIRQLLSDDASRNDAADWARPWISARADEISDVGVLRALERLASADMPTSDREYLYGREDFTHWLEDLSTD